MAGDAIWSEYYNRPARLGRAGAGLLRTRSWKAYYFFVEDVCRLDGLICPDGPTGRPLDPADTGPGRQTRFRGSGVEIPGFERGTRSFEPLSEDITPMQRSKRRSQLREYFSGNSVWLFDIHVADQDPEAAAIRATLRPASWHVILVGKWRTKRPMRPTFSCPYDAVAAGKNYERGELRSIGPVAPPAELRLRDVFSLNHVPPAELISVSPTPPGPRPWPDTLRLIAERLIAFIRRRRGRGGTVA